MIDTKTDQAILEGGLGAPVCRQGPQSRSRDSTGGGEELRSRVFSCRQVPQGRPRCVAGGGETRGT